MRSAVAAAGFSHIRARANAVTILSDSQPDNGPGPKATGPYALIEAPKKMPTTTLIMNFAMLSAPDRTD